MTDYQEILIPHVRYEERTDGTYRITEYFYPTQGGTAPVKIIAQRVLIIPDNTHNSYLRDY